VTTPPPFRHFLTARDTGARLSRQANLARGNGVGAGDALRIHPERPCQRMEGFGGAFTEAAATTWLKLPNAERDRLLRDYFDPEAGHGYTLCRVHMGSCDFALGNYAHLDDADDVKLARFSIERDRQALLPFIKAAQAVATSGLQLLVSPWSPPAWMKTSGRMNAGGSLLPQHRRTWARCYARFIAAYEAEGVPVWGVTVQNEPAAEVPWDSCLYTAEDERDFVRDFLGPELAAAGLGHVRILIWDHNRDQMVERARTVLSDPAAARYVWGTAFHWYGEDHFDHVQQVHDEWPDKQLLFTEGCQEGGTHRGSWALGERYGRSMINDLNRWTVGWIDWNLLLDHDGGPNHVGNLCSAPLLANRAGDGYEPENSYYYIGHFSRFIRPGARRLASESTSAELDAIAFANPDGSTVVVAMNRQDHPLRFTLTVGEQSHVAELPPRSIATYVR
jgi:glucosylceramidase